MGRMPDWERCRQAAAMRLDVVKNGKNLPVLAGWLVGLWMMVEVRAGAGFVVTEATSDDVLGFDGWPEWMPRMIAAKNLHAWW